MPDRAILQAICAEAAGIDLTACAPELKLRVETAADRFRALPAPWPNPKETRARLSAATAAVASLRKALTGLDEYTLNLIEVSVFWAEQDCGEVSISPANTESNDGFPADGFVERRLDAIDLALKHAARILRLNVWPARRGHPLNVDAYKAALFAAVAYQELTGKEPGYWNADRDEPTTPYVRMVRRIYDELGIKADVKKPIEWALGI